MNYSTLGKTGLKISKIGLGTAEIGFEYGIADRPLPNENESIDLLKKAVELGINFFDTANYYGLSEERIGKSGILKNPDIIVETKCAQFLEKGEYFPIAELEQKIRTQVQDSLSKLQINSLPILMIHGPNKEQIEKGELIEILQKFKKEGLIRFIGVSTRGEDAPLSAITSNFFDIIQVAYSILDQRMATRVFVEANKNNIGVVNRSVLLKGSLTPLREKLPKGLELLKSNADKANKIAISLGIDLPTLAIRFAIDNPLISTSLIGTNKKENLEKAVKTIEMGPLPTEIINELKKLAINDPKQVDPAQWPKL
ncbi:MAG: aldo/keto reductase [Patescibacteria group bacterium]|nr:aldo/keto reductase [Patescibacteria group bacterium]